MNQYTISILVNNRPGVLVRLSQTFARRGYNVDSLVVSPAQDERFSQVTVVVQGLPETFDQILKQLNKLVDVVHAKHHKPSHTVEREQALFKVLVNSEKRVEVFQLVDVFRGKTIDITDSSMIIEVTGDSSKIHALQQLLQPIGIVEMVRSGKLIMVRGQEVT